MVEYLIVGECPMQNAAVVKLYKNAIYMGKNAATMYKTAFNGQSFDYPLNI